MPSQHENIVKTIDSYLKLAHGTQETEEGEHDKQDTQSVGEREPQAESVPCALLTAGFHTGRRTIADFVEIATGSRTGPSNTQRCTSVEQEQEHEHEHEHKHKQETDHQEGNKPEASQPPFHAAELFEIDVDHTVRPWLPEREGETKDQTNRWCVVAVLARRY